jgi:DNA-binding transcriptional MerR regulator
MTSARRGSGLWIGQVAAESGVSIKTIRFYEDIGLLTLPDRTEGGFRLFSREVLNRLAFIKQAQSLGMSLQEIKEFLDIRDQGSYPCAAIRERMQAKILEIDTRVAELILLKHHLLDILETWQEPTEIQESTICPNLEVIAKNP